MGEAVNMNQFRDQAEDADVNLVEWLIEERLALRKAEDDLKTRKEAMNSLALGVLPKYGLKSITREDGVGISLVHGCSVSINRERLIVAMAAHLNADVVASVVEAATTRKPYDTVMLVQPRKKKNGQV